MVDLPGQKLSELPDDVLLHALSSLTMKEAGRTSILSKRWRYLWSNIPDLNFHPHFQFTIMEISVAQTILESETPRYISWVDQVVRSYRRPTVGDFCVQLQRDYVQNVANWVRFAMEKKVKKLQIDVVLLSGGQLSHYTFPDTFSDDLLNYLKLTGVNVTGETLEKLLVNCQVLEYLWVENSDSLIELKVVGQSLQLKDLIVRYCKKIKELEISAPNLVHVTYHGPEIIVSFENNPKLAKVSLGGDYAFALTNAFMEHSSYLSQLEVIELVLQCTDEFPMVSDFPKLERLRTLSVHIISPLPCLALDYMLFRMPDLIDKCPFLCKFTLNLNNDTYVNGILNCKGWTIIPHHHLKIVKIVGLYGNAGVEFAIGLLEIVVSLEKITIDHHKLRSPLKFASSEAKRNVAKQLPRYLKPGTDLVIF